MGLGIKQRYKNNEKQWDNHHKLAHSFICKALSEIDNNKSKSILILGCGRLYDFPVAQLDNFKSVTIVDADPLALFVAKHKLKKLSDISVNAICLDVSSVVDKFDKSIDDLPEVPIGGAGLEPHDVVVSLNLLGQIPLYFFDRIEKFNLNFNQDDLLKFSDQLQTQHIAGVVKLARNKAIFIYDKTFFFIEPDKPAWQEVSATTEEVFLPYIDKCKHYDKWYWSVEQNKGQGAIHLIEARSFSF
jgi:hypothetical protein